DLLAQGIELAEGHRRNIDLKELGQNALAGAIGGASGHLVGKGLGGAAGRLGLGSAARSLPGKAAIGAATGVGADATTQYLTTGKVDTSTLLGSGLSGGAGAGLHAGATSVKHHSAPPKPGGGPHDLPDLTRAGGDGNQDGPPKFGKPGTSSSSSYHGPELTPGAGSSRTDGLSPFGTAGTTAPQGRPGPAPAPHRAPANPQAQNPNPDLSSMAGAASVSRPSTQQADTTAPCTAPSNVGSTAYEPCRLSSVIIFHNGGAQQGQ
ncbi:hypothetical protein ACIHEI_15755, partial [Kitasatospora sp. NPDC051984]